MLKNYNSTVIKGRSLNTVTPYHTDILMFFDFLCNRRKMERAKYDLSMIDTDFIQSIKLNDMYTFISHCQMENNASAGTRARKIVSIRQFWKYLKNKAHAIDNNVAEVIPPTTGEMSAKPTKGGDLRLGVWKPLRYRNEYQSI